MDNLSVSSKIVQGQPYKTPSSNKTFSIFNLPQKTDNFEIKNSELKSKYKAKEKNNINLPVLASTLIGTLIPLAILKSKKMDTAFAAKGKETIINAFKKFNIFDIKYGLKEMLFVSTGSILGGLTGGLLSEKADNKEDKKNKIKESIFQMVNIAVPATSVFCLTKLAKQNNLLKVAALLGGILGGMPLGAIISNGINRLLFDKTGASDRKIALKDYIVHIDDVLGAFAFMRIPGLDQVVKLLPALYAMCGYNAGTGGEHK